METKLVECVPLSKSFLWQNINLHLKCLYAWLLLKLVLGDHHRLYSLQVIVIVIFVNFCKLSTKFLL